MVLKVEKAWARKTRLLHYFFQFVHLNVLWCHEEDSSEDATVHFCHRDGEDWQPWEYACKGVDHSQDRKTQYQPNVSAKTTLQTHTRNHEYVSITRQVIQITSNFLPSDLRFFWVVELGKVTQWGERKTTGGAHSPYPLQDPHCPPLEVWCHSLSASQRIYRWHPEPENLNDHKICYSL